MLKHYFSVILFLKRKMEDRTHCHNGSALHASTLNMNKVNITLNMNINQIAPKYEQGEKYPFFVGVLQVLLFG